MLKYSRRLAGDGVEAEIAAPDVAVLPLLDALVVLDDPRRLVELARRDMRVEHVSRLADVVIDADRGSGPRQARHS